MSSEESERDPGTLEEDLIAATSRVSEQHSKVRELRDDAANLSDEYRTRLPRFTGQWSKESVENHLSELDRIIREPQVTQSEERFKEIGVPDAKINTIKRDTLRRYSEIDSVVKEYEYIQNAFGEYIEFLVEDEYLVDWIQEHGPIEAKHKIEIENEVKYQNLASLENIPEQLKKTFFQQIYLGRDGRSIDQAQNLNGWIETLQEYDVKIQYNGDTTQFIQDVEEAIDQSQKLQKEFGYPDGQIRNWVKGLNVTEAKRELDKKIEEANQKQDRLQQQLEEYCELLGKDVPDLETIPELEEKVTQLSDELSNKIGDTGEQILEFLRGRRDKLPEAEEQENVMAALEKIRPLIQRKLDQE